MQILTTSKMWKNGNLTYFEAVFDIYYNGITTVFKKPTDMNIASNISSVGNNKKTGWRNSLFNVKVIKTSVHDLLFKFGMFTCFVPISGWVNKKASITFTKNNI